MSLVAFLKEYAREKYHYWRFRSYSKKLYREHERDLRERCGSDFERFLGKILPKD